MVLYITALNHPIGKRRLLTDGLSAWQRLIFFLPILLDDQRQKVIPKLQEYKYGFLKTNILKRYMADGMETSLHRQRAGDPLEGRLYDDEQC